MAAVMLRVVQQETPIHPQLLRGHSYPSYATDSECMPVYACVFVPRTWSHYRMSCCCSQFSYEWSPLSLMTDTW